MSAEMAGLFEHLFQNIPNDWKLMVLPDALDFQEGPGILAKDFHESGVPLLRLSSISGPVTTFQGCNYLDSDKVKKKWEHFKLIKRDILLSTSGSLGRVSEVAEQQEGSICYTGIIRFRPKTKDILPSFIKYFLQSQQFKQQAESSAAGSVLSHFGPTHLKKMSFPLPPLKYQRFIESLLSPIDDKIQLNQQINQTLEQMAQAIFKSWFVDFEPVKAKVAALEAGGSDEYALIAAMQAVSGKDADQLATMRADQPEQYAELRNTAQLFPSAMQESEFGEIPRGWQFSDIDKTTSLIIDHRGKTPKKLGGDWSETGYVALSAKHIKNGQIVNRDQLRCVNEELYIKWMKDELQKGDILLTSEGPMGELYYLSSDEKYCLSQRVYALRADVEKINLGFLYHWLNSPLAKADMEGRATGTTVVGIRQAELRKVKVICPQKSLTDAFGKVAQSSLDTSALLTKESLSLSAIRDSLLPRLLSGELGVEGGK